MIPKAEIIINNQKVEAFAPLIISASRATDIPAFYSDWLMKNFERNYVEKINPFNGQRYYISLQNVRFIVFWSKNPKPLLKHLDYFDKKNIGYYFQFTLNDYPEFELNLPTLSERIKIFKKLSQLLGKQRVIWRFDPLIISDKLNIKKLIGRIENIAEQINTYTQKLVISFVDLKYRKVQNNLKKHGFKISPFTEAQKRETAYYLEKIGENYSLAIKTCAEATDLSEFNIFPNKCIDDELIAKISFNDKILMNYLQCEKDIFSEKIICKNAKKDKGQRKFCRCIESKDIGFYDSCPHKCLYCYANKNFEKSIENFKKINSNFTWAKRPRFA